MPGDKEQTQSQRLHAFAKAHFDCHLPVKGKDGKPARPFSARLVWAPWLSMMVQAYQQPITETQLRLMTSLT